MFNKYGKQFGLSIDKQTETYGYDRYGRPQTHTYWAYKDADGNIIKFNNPDGTSDSNDAVMYDVAAAMEMLHGQYRSKIIDENQRRLAQMLYGKSTVEDVKIGVTLSHLLMVLLHGPILLDLTNGMKTLILQNIGQAKTLRSLTLAPSCFGSHCSKLQMLKMPL